MKNITVTVPDDVYRNARIRAAERGTPVSALVGEYLRSLSGRGRSSPGSRRSRGRPSARSSDSGRGTASIVTNSTTVRFVDTNVLLYAISRDPEEQDKAARANDILAVRDIALSVRVLQEFYVQATRLSRPDPLTHEQATGLVESFLRFPVLDVTTDLMLAAAATCQRFGVSYWDAAILEAARSLGCDLVLSEELSDGEDYADVRVQNPFRTP